MIIREQLAFTLYSPRHEARLCLRANPDFGSVAAPDQPVRDVERPYALNISAGKNSYAYDAHTYHTKVPPEGIKLLIQHFTNHGDVVLDPFCGSGMTGIAATELGRTALLSDLSPAAVFIAYNLNTPIDSVRYLNAVNEVMRRSMALEDALYATECRICGTKTPMIYTVWSYGLICNLCRSEFLLWDVARDERESVRESKILAEFSCPHCHQQIKKRGLRRTRRYPVQIGYKCCERSNKEQAVELDAGDLRRLECIEGRGIPADLWYPTDPFPVGVNTKQPIAAGITSVDKCYTTRALHAMAHLWALCSEWPEADVREKLLFTLTSLYQRVTLFSEFRFWGGSGNTANYNVPAIINEQNVFRTFLRKAHTISWYFKSAAAIDRRLQVSTQSATKLHQLSANSIDYVFTDVPFGSNINYSEMNFLWESWLQHFTDNTDEAIVNAVQCKSYGDYQALLRKAFEEIRRVLKADAWLTVVFHNSSAKAWAAIQHAIIDAGFVISGTQTFDKEHGTFKMFVSDNAVGYDLVLHCRKCDAPPTHLIRNKYAKENVLDFITKRIRSGDALTVRYLHVNRANEFDYRRLYADWLAYAVPHQLVQFDFDSFRLLVDEVRQEVVDG